MAGNLRAGSWGYASRQALSQCQRGSAAGCDLLIKNRVQGLASSPGEGQRAGW